jgi:hypothetical protein
MSEDDEMDFFQQLRAQAAAQDAPAYGIADRREANLGWRSWYTAVALPDGRIGAWVLGGDEAACEKALEQAHES